MTMKHILASTALATLLAGGVFAQTTPAADPALEPAAPMTEPATPMAPEADAAAPAADPAAPVIVEDETVAPDAAVPEVVEDDTMAPDPAAPAVVEDDTLAPDPAAPMTADADWAPVDLATFSTDRLIGADIVTGDDQTVATIEDVLINDDGSVENVVAKLGGFLGFGANQVLLTMDEIEVMQDPNENLLVRTTLTPESIETRPVYE